VDYGTTITNNTTTGVTTTPPMSKYWVTTHYIKTKADKIFDGRSTFWWGETNRDILVGPFLPGKKTPLKKLPLS
jgi:hypothetical protein